MQDGVGWSQRLDQIVGENLDGQIEELGHLLRAPRCGISGNRCQLDGRLTAKHIDASSTLAQARDTVHTLQSEQLGTLLHAGTKVELGVGARHHGKALTCRDQGYETLRQRLETRRRMGHPHPIGARDGLLQIIGDQRKVPCHEGKVPLRAINVDVTRPCGSIGRIHAHFMASRRKLARHERADIAATDNRNDHL